MDERSKIVQRGVRNLRNYKPSWRVLKRPKPSPLRLLKELVAGILASCMFYVICIGDAGNMRWLIAGILFVTSCILVASRP